MANLSWHGMGLRGSSMVGMGVYLFEGGHHVYMQGQGMDDVTFRAEGYCSSRS